VTWDKVKIGICWLKALRACHAILDEIGVEEGIPEVQNVE
jgi:hypothetical protein